MILTRDQKDRIIKLPKAEIGCRWNSSVPWQTAQKLAEKKHSRLPYETVADIRKWASTHNIDSGLRNAIAASYCWESEDYIQILRDMGKRVSKMHIMHKELYFDFPELLKGVSLETLAHGLRAGREAFIAESGASLSLMAEITCPESEEAAERMIWLLHVLSPVINGVAIRLNPMNVPFDGFKRLSAAVKEMRLFCSCDASAADENLFRHIFERSEIDRWENPPVRPDAETICRTDRPVSWAFSVDRILKAPSPGLWTERMKNAGIAVSLLIPEPEYGDNILTQYAFLLTKGKMDFPQVEELVRNGMRFSTV